MKEDTIHMKREVWDYLRSYRKAPIKKRYLENVKLRELIEIKRKSNQQDSND